MTLALILLGAISVVELLLYVSPFWLARRVLAAGTLVVLAGFSGLLFADKPCLATGVLLLVSLYRVFNLLRVVQGRMNPQYLRRVTLRTSGLLMLYQLIILACWSVTTLGVKAHVTWFILALVQLIVAGIVFASTRKNLKATQTPIIEQHFADRDLPSITVCIPARNETEALEDCLQSLVTSNYLKLEILVLDDCSQDRTPDIIKSFAHAGIRFVKGTEPPTNWLAKNWAYKQLSEEANGEILVFAGVDVRFSPGSLRALITAMQAEKRQMACLIPRNEVTVFGRAHQSTLLQPLRYAWELCLPRLVFHRAPVLSSCWAIERGLLGKAGGFESVATAITPESHFAKQTGSAYRFWQANNDLEVTSTKGFSEQWNTAVRTRYPQLHRRPELVALLSLAQLSCLIFPFLMLIGGLVEDAWLFSAICAISCVLLCWTYSTVSELTYRTFLGRSIATLPVAILLDIAIRHYSMWRYEFSEVLWKGRNVCLPVMHVVPRLPKFRLRVS